MSFYILALNKFMSILNTSQAFFAWVMMQKAHTKKTQKKSFLIAQSSVKSSTKSFSVNLFFFISFNDSWKCLLLHDKVAESVFTSSILLQHVFSQCLTSIAPPPPEPLLITHQQYLSVCELPTRISTGSCTKPSSASPAPRRSALGLWTSVGPCHRCLINPRRRKVENHWCEGQNWTEEVASTPRSARRKPPTL